MLSLFVNHYSYSVSEFDLLTPVQAFTILQGKTEIEKTRYAFWQNEFRRTNYIIHRSGFSPDKRIKKYSDLYPLDSDDMFKTKFTPERIEYYSRKLTPEEIKIIKAL